MTAAHAAALSHLQALRSACNAALRQLSLISQNGTTKEWMEYRRTTTTPACEAVNAEEQRIIAAGFGGDIDFEIAVLGHMQRRHSDPVRVTYSDLR